MAAPKIEVMSSPPPLQGPVRSAEAVNAEIRALLERTRRQLSAVERAEYDLPVAEYEAAVRWEMTTAA